MSEPPAKARPSKVLTWLSRTLLGLLALIILLGVLVPFGTLPFEFIALLFFGWFPYLERVIPQVHFNAEMAFDASVALALAVFGLHRILCWWVKDAGGKSAPWRFGWTLKITVMVLLLFATSIAAVGIVHQIGWLCREPKLIVMKGMSAQTRELSHLKQTATALNLYAEEHEGQFPKRLADLVPKYLPTQEMFFTSVWADEPPQPVIYYSGYGTRDDKGTIVLASPSLYDLGYGLWRVVVHRDTSGLVMCESRFQELIQKQLSAGGRGEAHSR